MNNLKLNFSLNRTIATIQTNLPVAFDTIDHQVLLQTLEYYRARDSELTFMPSFLTGQSQFVKADGIRSDTLES